MNAALKLEKLLIDEISGVDDPANMAPGWMLAKARKRKLEVEILSIDGKGFWAIEKHHIDELRTKGGDAAVEKHYEEVFRALGLSPEKITEGSGVTQQLTKSLEDLAAKLHSKFTPTPAAEPFFRDANATSYKRIF